MKKPKRDVAGEDTKKVTGKKSGAYSSKQCLFYHDVPPELYRRIAKRHSEGHVKYTPKITMNLNWRSGLDDPHYVMDRLNHLYDHAFTFLDDGNELDDNLAAIAWCVGFLMEVERVAPHVLKQVLGQSKFFGKSAQTQKELLERETKMKIVRPYAELMPPPGFETCSFDLSMGVRLLKRIEWSARISHRSEDAPSSWGRFLKNVVIDHGDWSVVEHVSVSVDAVMDRGITHEWVRHRLFGFTQESTRFVNYEKKMPPAFIYPKVETECVFCLSGNEVRRDVAVDSKFKHWVDHVAYCAYDQDWLTGREANELEYKTLIAKGWRPQEARSGLPNALASRIITTGNLRNWRHFLLMRTCAEAHPQMRQITIPLLEEFKTKIPLLFDDIVPNEKQSLAMKKAR